EIFIVLYENKIIDEPLKESLCNMAGFRNILVHDYMKLDRIIVYKIINNNLKDIETFIKIVSTYL
ncbi:MAG: HepT-like ribonuclease domain-containing protein, partial [Clostridium sp.]